MRIGVFICASRPPSRATARACVPAHGALSVARINIRAPTDSLCQTRSSTFYRPLVYSIQITRVMGFPRALRGLHSSSTQPPQGGIDAAVSDVTNTCDQLWRPMELFGLAMTLATTRLSPVSCVVDSSPLPLVSECGAASHAGNTAPEFPGIPGICPTRDKVGNIRSLSFIIQACTLRLAGMPSARGDRISLFYKKLRWFKRPRLEPPPPCQYSLTFLPAPF